MIADAAMLAQAAVAGKLTIRADASQHQGDYRKVVEGVNHTLDAVITPLREVADVIGRTGAHGQRAEGTQQQIQVLR